MQTGNTVERAAETAVEAWGFKILGGGSAAGAAGFYATLDPLAVVGVAVAVCGLLIQILESHSRRKAAKEEQRLNEAQREQENQREIEQHALQVQILQSQLADLRTNQVPTDKAAEVANPNCD